MSEFQPSPIAAQPATTTYAGPPAEEPFRADHCQEVMRRASSEFRRATGWASYFRAVLGVEGVVRRYFKTADTLAQFERTAEYAEIQKMVVKLREQSGRRQRDEQEPTRVITVRMPQSLHESLRLEADDKQTSMNKLCISKLLQMIDGQFIPTD